MMNYVCDVCGYEYDPAENNNIPFEDLPEDWVCPVCGAGKEEFSKQD
ncbi:MAG: rubredoxin [Desulfovibrionaceae bacterium]|nr:rubredoxin [Desulfovibrionaceae bacterium]